MKCLIVEKRPDGTYQSTAYINADGSATITVYKNTQEAVLAIPVLGKQLSGLEKDSDRVTLFFNADGIVDRGSAHVFSVDKDDAGQKSDSLDPARFSHIYDLVNDVKTKVISEEPEVNE